ncbi:TetR family transcriptional regulator [Aquiluna borgnonia]|uniref:TetR family transcriptional regulator n=1 Tax=Aquiluna borgnonia TaxID=2499157 RepID=A0A7D4TIL3_9MICO|nr:TetR/AcrR family transcriptional regulator [Aquiluna borgnonia]QKJ24951.1 TetR family transcriptional regulator [Aquiluna borgnonia]
MARPRKFNEGDVIALAGQTFAKLGFHGTSIDDLLLSTNLQRGSLYQAFGSKLGLFKIVLASALNEGWEQRDLSLNLMIVAIRDLAGEDRDIRNLCVEAIEKTFNDSTLDAAKTFGMQLLKNLEETHAKL